MTNGEWLDYLAHNAPDELSAWFDAEHVETEERALDGDTAALNAKIAYPMHHGYKGVKADMVIFDELHDEHDSREKLEADAGELTADYAASGEVCDALHGGIITLLDRQAAITEREVEHDLMKAGRMAVEVERERIKKLTAERERYREKFGKCLDYADAIHALMDDEGMA